MTNHKRFCYGLLQIRWVVESANARIKRWKYLDHVLPTNQIHYVGDYIRIVCAISNKYLPPLSAARDDVAVAAKMLHLSTRVNALKDRVERDNLDKRIVIWKAGSSISDFPRLSEEQLRDITCGTYQLKLASSYIQEHLDGNCDIYVHKEDEHLIRVKIQSRHISSKMHLLWIAYDDTEKKGWYCKCKTEARVVGVCAHIASMISYLGYARFEASYRGVRNWAENVEDAAKIPQEIDASDSDDSVIEE